VVTTLTAARLRVAAACVLAVTTLGACSRDGRTLAPALPEQTESVAIAPTDTTVSLAPSDDFSVTGPWMEGGDIDLAFTCYGRKVSPPLQILGQPGGTVSMAVLLHSVDAPEDVLWLMANIAGGTVALGDGTAGFSPPCPPSGERRQYLLTVFALDTRLDVATVTAADGAIDSEQLLTAVEMATFDLAEATFYVQAP
jgi:phosphatidylethanolamine-binding protein (PEBP) family uncharacterized protein